MKMLNPECRANQFRRLVRSSRCFHPTSHREIAPLVVAGIGIFVASNVALYVLRAMEEEKAQAANMGVYNRAQNKYNSDGSKSNNRNLVMVDNIGIDMGSGHMKFAVLAPENLNSGQLAAGPEVIENRTGQRSTITMVQFGDDSIPVVGSIAKSRRFSDPGATIFDFQVILLE
jgi:hypothetical protein